MERREVASLKAQLVAVERRVADIKKHVARTEMHTAIELDAVETHLMQAEGLLRRLESRRSR